jgi:hypothetical protein
MNKVFSILFFVICLTGYSQKVNKSVSLVVTGEGNNLEEAKQNALRMAIEQAFGVFVSSNSQILNDNLVKDEIISITNGNIENYELISQLVYPNGYCTITLKALLSIDKLSSFIENKGYQIDYKGENYALNLKNIELNKINENKVISNLENAISGFLNNIYSYKIKAEEPIFLKEDQYLITIHSQVIPNDNFEKLITYVTKTLKQLSLTQKEIENLKGYNFPVYDFEYIDLYSNTISINFRNEYNKDFFIRFIEKLEEHAYNIKITDGNKTLSSIETNINLNDKKRWDDYKKNYSAFTCIKSKKYNENNVKPIDLSLLKINSCSILDKEKYFLFSLNELSKIKSFNVINGLNHDSTVIDAFNICLDYNLKKNKKK